MGTSELETVKWDPPSSSSTVFPVSKKDCAVLASHLLLRKKHLIVTVPTHAYFYRVLNVTIREHLKNEYQAEPLFISSRKYVNLPLSNAVGPAIAEALSLKKRCFIVMMTGHEDIEQISAIVRLACLLDTYATEARSIVIVNLDDNKCWFSSYFEGLASKLYCPVTWSLQQRA